MASAHKYPYLTRCVENTSDLPAELHRYFKMLRDLDQKAHTNMRTAEAEAARMRPGAGRSDSGPPSKRSRGGKPDRVMDDTTAKLINEAVELSEEKLSVATQVYDYVDGLIKELDADIAAYAAELKRDRQKLNIPEHQTATQILAEKEAGRRGGTTTKQKGGRGRKREVEEVVQVSAPEPIAINLDAEPRYCLCNGISAGDMVACEYEGCEKEWFHFECVGLTEEPEGKWYCPNCIGLVEPE